jgi:hypothetical protein
MGMGNFLIVIGLLILSYTVIALFTGLPQVSDFLPVGFFDDSSTADSFYKVVNTQSSDKGPWVVSAIGIIFLGAGFVCNYFFR